jgi:hypothetical protein
MPATLTEHPGIVDQGTPHEFYSPFIKWEAESTSGRYGEVQRRGRAAQISAAKRAWVKAHPGHFLFLCDRSYSETWGFLHQSAFRYRVIRCDAITGDVSSMNCSDDLRVVWYGKETPALACGYHAGNYPCAVYRGHHIRAAYEAEQYAKLNGKIWKWPYK